MSEITKANKPQRLAGLSAMLDHVAGKVIDQEESAYLSDAVTKLCDNQDADYNAEVAWFSDGTGLLVAITPTGPGYSEVTPDPQWDASVNYFAVVRSGKPPAE